MAEKAQSADSHAKMVPLYHYIGFGALFVPTVYFGVRVVTDFGVWQLMLFVFAVGVIIAALFARIFPLGVQDRVIRLEERMRMHELLPADMHGRISEFSTDQLIGLRFASDAELPELAARVLKDGMDRKAIKHAIKAWRADHQRI